LARGKGWLIIKGQRDNKAKSIFITLDAGEKYLGKG